MYRVLFWWGLTNHLLTTRGRCCMPRSPWRSAREKTWAGRGVKHKSWMRGSKLNWKRFINITWDIPYITGSQYVDYPLGKWNTQPSRNPHLPGVATSKKCVQQCQLEVKDILNPKAQWRLRTFDPNMATIYPLHPLIWYGYGRWPI